MRLTREVSAEGAAPRRACEGHLPLWANGMEAVTRVPCTVIRTTSHELRVRSTPFVLPAKSDKCPAEGRSNRSAPSSTKNMDARTHRRQFNTEMTNMSPTGIPPISWSGC